MAAYLSAIFCRLYFLGHIILRHMPDKYDVGVSFRHTFYIQYMA